MAIDKQAVLEQLDQDTQRFRGLVNGDENDTVELEQRTEKSVAGQVKERVDEVIVGDYIRVANWEDLSGSFSPPLIVRYNSFYYQLNGSVSEIENETPVNNPNYTRVNSDLKERLRREATLDLDFQRGKYRKDDGELVETTDASELLTVQRATPKWVWGPNGKLREVPPDTEAREWCPETGKPLGVLIEGEATNLTPYSSDFLDGSWVKNGVESIDIDGMTAAGTQWHKITSTDGGQGRVRQELSVDSGYLTSTFYVAYENWRWVRVTHFGGNITLEGSRAWVDIENGVLGQTTPAVTAKVRKYGGGVEVSMTSPIPKSGIVVSDVRLAADDGDEGNSPEGVNSYRIGFAQIEQGPTPTSYIPTDGAPVTRAADDFGVELSSGFSPESGSVVQSISRWGHPVGVFDTSVVFSGGGTSLAVRSESSNTLLGARVEDLDGVATTPGTRRIPLPELGSKVEIAFSYKKGVGAFVYANQNDIGFVERSFNPSWGGEVLLRVGSVGNASYHVAELLYLPYTLSEAELIELTTISEEE